MTDHYFREAVTSMFDKGGIDVYTRIWYYTTIANKMMEHHIKINSTTTSVESDMKMPALRFFGVRLIDEELSKFINQKIKLDSAVDPNVLLQYRRYIKPLLTTYVNATEEERAFVIVVAKAESAAHTTTTTSMSKFTVGIEDGTDKKSRRVYISKTVGDDPDHSDNLGAFGDYFQHIMRVDSPPIDAVEVDGKSFLNECPDVSFLNDNATELSKKYANFIHDLILTFIHHSHAVACGNE
jgi:hypothetical protein